MFKTFLSLLWGRFHKTIFVVFKVKKIIEKITFNSFEKLFKKVKKIVIFKMLSLSDKFMFSKKKHFHLLLISFLRNISKVLLLEWFSYFSLVILSSDRKENKIRKVFHSSLSLNTKTLPLKIPRGKFSTFHIFAMKNFQVPITRFFLFKIFLFLQRIKIFPH